MCGGKVLRHHLEEHARACHANPKMKRVAVAQRLARAGFVVCESLPIDRDFEVILTSMGHQMKRVFVVVYVRKHAFWQRTTLLWHKLQITGVRSAQGHVLLCKNSCLTLLSAREVDEHQPAHSLLRLARSMIAPVI